MSCSCGAVPWIQRAFPCLVLLGRGERSLGGENDPAVPLQLQLSAHPQHSELEERLKAGVPLEYLCALLEQILEAFSSPAQAVPAQFSWRGASPVALRGGEGHTEVVEWPLVCQRTLQGVEEFLVDVRLEMEL